QQKTKGSCQIRRKALELFQLHHIHPHRFDDLFSAHAGAHTHHCGTQHHQPYRDHHTFHTILSIAERHAKEQHADKLLTVLRSMHKTHKGRSKDLAAPEEGIRLSAVHICTKQGYSLAD